MGLRIQLGHDSAACSNPKRAPQSFTVLDINGVHLLDVDYCDCEQSTPRRIQLLRAGWYPATVHYPSTCATLGLLKHFHGLSLCSKVSAYEYYLNLERLTDSSRVDIPNVCQSVLGSFNVKLIIYLADTVQGVPSYGQAVPP